MIKTAPENERAGLIKKVIEDIEVDTSGLTKEQRYQLALKKLHTSSRRFQTTAIVVVIIAVLTAVLAVYAINRTDSRKVETAPSLSVSPFPSPIGSVSATPPPSLVPTPSPLASPKQSLPKLNNAESAITPALKNTNEQSEPTLHPDIASNGEVAGYVYDAEAQNPIQGAVVVAKNEATKAEYQAATNGAGSCSIVVPAGAYSVTVSRDGYIKHTQHCKTSYSSQCGLLVRPVKVPK